MQEVFFFVAKKEAEQMLRLLKIENEDPD
jgi:hypothetical protein